jgi:hypothetical protein
MSTEMTADHSSKNKTCVKQGVLSVLREPWAFLLKAVSCVDRLCLWDKVYKT